MCLVCFSELKIWNAACFPLFLKDHKHLAILNLVLLITVGKAGVISVSKKYFYNRYYYSSVKQTAVQTDKVFIRCLLAPKNIILEIHQKLCYSRKKSIKRWKFVYEKTIIYIVVNFSSFVTHELSRIVVLICMLQWN